MGGSTGRPKRWRWSNLSLVAVCGCTPPPTELDGSGADSGDETETDELGPARGISITRVEVNQGTRVDIGDRAEWIAADERTSYLVGSRDSLLRVHYTVDPDWIPRDIEARLLLDLPDGTSATLSRTERIEGDSTPDSLDGGLWFLLVAEAGQTVAGVEYQVELWETQTELGGELPESIWANPSPGPMPIGFEPTPLELKVVLVPITYTALATTANLDDATVEQFIANLYEQNPTSAVLYDVRPPVEYDQQLAELASLLPLLSQLKAADGAADNTYYHAFVDVEAPSLGGLQGIGNITTDAQADGLQRVAATVLWAGNPNLAAETFTHETGHNQGLAHVACPDAEAAAPDPDYPHADGLIGSWGFAIRRMLLFSPAESFDYMSYCGPSWVSDWTWNKTYERIATLTGWDGEGSPAPEPPATTTLLGAFAADGSTQWWTAPGRVDPERVSGSDTVTFVTDDGEVFEQWAQFDELSDGTAWIAVEVPVELDRVATIVHRRAEAAVEVPRASVVTGLAIEPWTPTFRRR